MNSKLERQLVELLEAGVITQETAQKITAYYRSKAKHGPNRLFMIFGVLGALLSGLGILLIIAHNWDGMPKALKTIFAFLPLLTGQIVSAIGLIRKKSMTWKESSATFLVLSVGATISLISQIYNIPGDLGDFLLLWATITAPLMYVLRSKLALVIHLVLITWYACSLGYFFSSQPPWWYVPLLGWVIPLYLQVQKEESPGNSAGLLNWLLPLSPILVLGSFTEGHSFSFIVYLILFGLLYNIGQLPHFKKQKLRRNGYAILGSLGSVVLLFFLTFEWFWKDSIKDAPALREVWVAVLLCLGGVLVIGYQYMKKHLERFNLFQYTFLIVVLLYATHNTGWAHNVILTNILLAALGLSAIRIGINTSSFGVLNYGLLIVTALIICRFLDSNLDFIVRGILFISVGAGFFCANYLLVKKQRNAAQHENPKIENHD